MQNRFLALFQMLCDDGSYSNGDVGDGDGDTDIRLFLYSFTNA